METYQFWSVDSLSQLIKTYKNLRKLLHLSDYIGYNINFPIHFFCSTAHHCYTKVNIIFNIKLYDSNGRNCYILIRGRKLSTSRWLYVFS